MSLGSILTAPLHSRQLPPSGMTLQGGEARRLVRKARLGQMAVPAVQGYAQTQDAWVWKER